MNIQMSAIKKQAKFPITRNVVKNGVMFRPELNLGDRVSCYYCNSPIRVNTKTAFTVPGDDTEMTYIECPKCGKRVSVLYYFDRKVTYEPRKKKNKPRTRTRTYVSAWFDDESGL